MFHFQRLVNRGWVLLNSWALIHVHFFSCSLVPSPGYSQANLTQLFLTFGIPRLSMAMGQGDFWDTHFPPSSGFSLSRSSGWRHIEEEGVSPGGGVRKQGITPPLGCLGAITSSRSPRDTKDPG